MTAVHHDAGRSLRADAGSLPIALLVTLVGMSLSALLVPMVLVQLGTTGNAVQRAAALHAAQSGLDVALGHLRAARDSAPAGTAAYAAGRRDRLPCGPLLGEGPGDGRFLVEVVYLRIDPVDLLAATDPYAAVQTSTDRISQCVPGAGLSVTPAYAVLFSWGTGRPTGDPRSGSGSRRLQAAYRFRTSTANIPGGAIRVRGTSGIQLCLDAGAAQPAAGTTVTMQSCQHRNPRQTFAYNENLTITLTSSRTAAQPLGMCLDANTPHEVGNPVVLQACTSVTQPSQQWSINDAANFVGTTDGATLDGYCFTVAEPDTPGSLVLLASGYPSCNGMYDNKQTFLPDALVGAGAAGAEAGQLVNFKQFGRCLDVTNLNPGEAYLIAWPCKQAPDPSYVAWNQKWRLPALTPSAAAPDRMSGTGTITTTRDGIDYCLRSPGSDTYGAYPRVVACPSDAPTPDLLWTVYGKTATYASSYRIKAGADTSVDAGLCLAVADPAATPLELYESTSYHGPPISKIVMRPCDSSTWQKWNAPADLLDASPLKNFAEN